MSTGAKIAIGCAVAVVVVGIVVIVGLGGAAYWLKGKAESFTADEGRIEELKKKANATPFQEPADGVIQEDRLVKFLEIRKRVYDVYQKHEAELEALRTKEKGDLGDVATGFKLLNEMRAAVAQAQADVGMSEDEYRFMVAQVYKTLWASEVAKSTGGKSVSEAAGEAYEKAAQEMERVARESEAAKEKAEQAAEDATTQEAKRDADQAVESMRKALGDLEKGAGDLKKQSEEVKDKARELDVPPANIALFRKYEAEIKKYAMGGLEWIGL